jgi:lipoprotein NlpI
MLQLCSRAVESKALPKDKLVSAYANRAYAYGMIEQYPDALQDYNEALKLDDEDTKSYAGRAQINDLMGNWRAAIKDYGAAIKLKPDYAAAYYNRGLVYAQHGDYTAAIADFTKTAELSPKDIDAIYNRAYAHYLTGAYGLAIADYTRTLERYPDYQNAIDFRGISHVLQGDWSRAKPDLTASHENDETDVRHMLLLYLSEAHTGSQDAARKALADRARKAALDSWPGVIVAHFIGKLTEKALFRAAATDADVAERAHRRGVISYYLAEKQTLRRNRKAAKALYEKAAALAEKGSVEQRAAEAALKRR